MKKLFAFILVLVMVTTVFVIPANATVVEYMYGDVNMDDSVDVLDATQIQLCLVGSSEMTGLQRELADFDVDKDLTVMDATTIQMYNAELIENPRNNPFDYLEFYVEIEDIKIQPYFGADMLAGEAIVFEVVFDEEYNPEGEKYVRYDYTFKGITDETYYETYEHDMLSYPYVSWSFPKPGIYEISVYIRKPHISGSYTFTKQFEVLPTYEFDQKRFVEYKYFDLKPWEFPSAPEDTSVIEYEMLVDAKAMDLGGGYGMNPVSDYYVALVHSKEEYDKLFNVDNEKFDDEFFKTKSLVVAVSPGFDHYDYSSIKGISLKDDVLYINVVYGNSYPDPNVSHPTAPTWYSFVAVDKADVENITSVQRVK